MQILETGGHYYADPLLADMQNPPRWCACMHELLLLLLLLLRLLLLLVLWPSSCYARRWVMRHAMRHSHACNAEWRMIRRERADGLGTEEAITVATAIANVPPLARPCTHCPLQVAGFFALRDIQPGEAPPCWLHHAWLTHC